MLQLIKYYLTFSNRYLILIGIFVSLHLLGFAFGSEMYRPSGTTIFPLLALPYGDMFLGVVKNGKIKFVFNQLPLSFTKVNIAKMSTIYIYIISYIIIAVLSAVAHDSCVEGIIAEMMGEISYSIILISMLIRVIYLLDQYKYINLITVAYLALGITYLYNIYPCHCDIYNLLGYTYGTWETTWFNLAVLLCFSILEIVIQYVNRNRIIYVGHTKLHWS